jgi:hypothetical protein
MYRANERASERACYYFPRLTVDEEGYFSDLSPGLVDWICRATRDITAVNEILGAYQDCLKVDLLESFKKYRPATDPIGNRTQQIGFYLILAHFFESVADEPVGCVSFYSSGAQAAYVFSGVFTMRQYLSDILPLNNANRIAISRAEQELGLSEMLVRRLTPGPSLEELLPTLIRNNSETSRIFLKDKRGSRCCLLAGFRDPMETLREELLNYGGELAIGRLKPASGAHIPVYDTATLHSLQSIIDSVSFKPPRCAISGASGELVEKASVDEDALRSTFLDGVIGPLDTGKAMLTASSLADKLIIVGTPFGARVLTEEITQKFGRPIFPSELVVPLAMLV